MDDDVDPSFHGSLSHFAYVDPRTSSLSSHRRPSHTHTDPETAAAQPRNGIPFSNVPDADDAGDGSALADIAQSSSLLASKRKAGKTTENQRAKRGSKRRNGQGILGRVDPGSDSCVRLNGIPDHVAKDLDGALRSLPHPYYVLRNSIFDALLLSSFRAVLFCGIKCVGCSLLHDERDLQL